MNPFSSPFEHSFNHLSQMSHPNEETFEQIEVDPSKLSFKRSQSKEESLIHDLPILPLQKHFSLPEQESNDTSDFSDIFKIRWAINQLIQMEFDINICYHIIQKMDISNKDPQVLFNEILDKYDQYLKEINFNGADNTQIDIRSFFETTHSLKNKQNKSFILKADPLDSRQENSVLIEMKPASEEIMDQNFKFCEICFERKELSKFYKVNNCHHIFCHECIINYLLQKINSSDLLKIPCPAGCDYDFREEEIQEILKNDPNNFQKYQKFKNLLIVNSDPNLRWCIRFGCNNLIRGKGNEKKIKCDKCGQEMCFRCRLVWHGRTTCVKALDNEFKIYSKNVLVKYCPKCRSRIEKNGGCNHMHCTRCKYEFCWLCMRKYSQNHYLWYNVFGCPLMQNSNIKWKRNLLYQSIKCLFQLIIVLVIVPLAIILSPFVLSMMILPALFFIYYRPKTKITKIGCSILLGILGLALTPIITILTIVPGSCLMYREYKRRIALN